MLRLVRRVLPASTDYDGDPVRHAVTGERVVHPAGARRSSRSASANVVFALDSIPAIFGLTTNTYIVFTANAFALMGLRQLYFLVGGLLERHRLPQHRAGGDPRVHRRQAGARGARGRTSSTSGRCRCRTSASCSRSASSLRRWLSPPWPAWPGTPATTPRPPDGRPGLVWAVSIALLVGLLAVDVFVIGRRPHEPRCASARSPSRSTSAWRCSSASGCWYRGAAVRRRVLRRLAHGVQPVDRQPVRVRHHHGQVRGAPAAAADGPAGRDHPGPGDARDLHRARRGGDPELQLGLLPVRRVPRLHRREAGHPGRERRGGLRGEPAAGLGRAAVPGHPGVARRQAHRPGRRQAGHDPDAHRHRRAGHDRPAVRARLDPGDLRAHRGALPGLRGQRVRADGPAAALLPHRRPAASGWST